MLSKEFEISHSEFLNLIISQFKLDIDTDHGIKHWRRVLEIGNYLTEETKADIEVVSFFAYLHDAKRESELHDPDHGARAADFTKELYKRGIIILTENQLEKLVIACRDHNNSGSKSQDITVQTCWDADRLDLWRTGIIPDPALLNTEFGKTDEAINFLR